MEKLIATDLPKLSAPIKLYLYRCRASIIGSCNVVEIAKSTYKDSPSASHNTIYTIVILPSWKEVQIHHSMWHLGCTPLAFRRVNEDESDFVFSRVTPSHSEV